MQSLQIKTNELKSNIINKDLKQLKKKKLKLISKDKNKCNESIENYNYYIKLTKKLKKYIEDDCEQIVDTVYDKYGNIVWLVAKFNISNMEIEMPVDIRIITVEAGDTFMSCSYYKEVDRGMLYINSFESRRPNCGYGNLLLDNLSYIISNINCKFEYINKIKDFDFKAIEIIRGKSIATKSIISQENLNRIYKKYGFEIDNKNNMIKKL
ncbi:MAG: hypothetical protein ACRC92_12590 [Peptostreptococcaceae bacterium]